MRTLVIACAAAALLPTAAVAQTTPSAPPVAPAAAPASPAHYTTADTEIGALLDDPAAKAIVEKNIPGMMTNDQIDMARGMTLKAVQQYSPDEVTDARLAAIDAEFAKLPVKK